MFCSKVAVKYSNALLCSTNESEVIIKGKFKNLEDNKNELGKF
jgi:hypothetical protein